MNKLSTWMQGLQAFRAGQPVDANPYRALLKAGGSTPLQVQGWDNGWGYGLSVARRDFEAQLLGKQAEREPLTTQAPAPVAGELAAALQEAQSWIRQFASVRSSEVDGRIQAALDGYHFKPSPAPAQQDIGPDSENYAGDEAPLPADVPYPPSLDNVTIYNPYGPMSMDPTDGQPVQAYWDRAGLRDYGARCIAWAAAQAPAVGADK